MEDTCSCPKCHNESAYFNGISYECPDCEYEWGFINEENSYEEEDVENFEFNRLSSLEKPFFTLKHGQLYECKMDFIFQGEFMTENTTIVPLAFKKNKNQFFVLTYAKKFYSENKKAIEDFIKMDFITIWNDGIRGYFDDSTETPMTCICATTEENSIIHSFGTFYDFIEVN